MHRASKLLTVILLFFTCSIFGQDCSQCKPRRLVLYDLSIDVDSANMPAFGSRAYFDVFYIAKGVRSYMMNRDLSRDCLTKIDGTIASNIDTSIIKSNKKAVLSLVTLPPDGENSLGHYLITGRISGGPGSYSVIVQLETCKTREVVKTSSVNYAAGTDPFNAGYQLASGLAPVYNTISTFEKKKRDEGEPFAIMPEVFIRPDVNELKTGRFTNVKFEFRDCDGKPLANRKLEITVTAGELESKSLTTDSEGKASTTFKAPDKEQTVSINCTYPFTHPAGHTDVAFCTPAAIKIIEEEEGIFADIVIEYSSTRTQRNEDEVILKSETVTQMRTKLSIDAAEALFKKFLEDPASRKEFVSSGVKLVTGRSFKKVIDEESGGLLRETRYPIHVNISSKTEEFKEVDSERKWVITEKKTAEGINDCEAIHIKVEPYSPTGDAMDLGLANYVILLSGAKYMDKMRSQSVGNGSWFIWDDSEQKLVQRNEPVLVSIPYSSAFSSQDNDGYRAVKPLLIYALSGFDEFMSDPVGPYSISLSGSASQLDDQTEFEDLISVTISFEGYHFR